MQNNGVRLPVVHRQEALLNGRAPEHLEQGLANIRGSQPVEENVAKRNADSAYHRTMVQQHLDALVTLDGPKATRKFYLELEADLDTIINRHAMEGRVDATS